MSDDFKVAGVDEAASVLAKLNATKPFIPDEPVRLAEKLSIQRTPGHVNGHKGQFTHAKMLKARKARKQAKRSRRINR